MEAQMQLDGTFRHLWQPVAYGLRGEVSARQCDVCRTIVHGPNEPADSGCTGFAGSKRTMDDVA
jgi:hypothetical protein